MMKKIALTFLAFASIALAGCAATYANNSRSIVLQKDTRIGVLPMKNNTETPQAGQRAQAMAISMLRTSGLHNFYYYKTKNNCDKLVTCPNKGLNMRRVKAWAHANHINYLFRGTVNEWRYKVGLDGEPAVSLTFDIFNIKLNHTIWNSVGSRVGGSRSSIGTSTVVLLRQIFDNIRVVN